VNTVCGVGSFIANLTGREIVPSGRLRLRGEVVVGQHVGVTGDRTAQRSDMDNAVLDVDDLCHGTGCTGANDYEPSRRDHRRVSGSTEERPG